MRYGLALLAAAAAVGGLGISAPAAGAIPFGADLGAPVDNTSTCPQLVQAVTFGQQTSPTCLFFSTNSYAPVQGTVTSVSVRTSPNGPTGPMQVVVMRSLFQNNPNVGVDPNAKDFFACCFIQQYGPTFTPAPGGAVTTVPTSLPMVEDPTPPDNDITTNARGDFLALSVLDPNVVFPAQTDPNSGYSWIFPAPNPANNPAPAPNPIIVGGSIGARVALAADVTPGSAGGGNNNPGAIVGALRMPTGGSLRGTTASIPLVCVLTTACEGILRLTNQTAGLASAAAKIRTYGRKKFKIPAGKTRRIKVKLNKAGKRKVRKRKKVKLTASATIGGKVQSSRVTLRKKKKR